VHDTAAIQRTEQNKTNQNKGDITGACTTGVVSGSVFALTAPSDDDCLFIDALPLHTSVLRLRWTCALVHDWGMKKVKRKEDCELGDASMTRGE
jgi:hypothetical protein